MESRDLTKRIIALHFFLTHPTIAKKSVYTPQNEPKIFHPAQFFFLDTPLVKENLLFIHILYQYLLEIKLKIS